MKIIKTLIGIYAVAIISGCGKPALTENTAEALIEQGNAYPHEATELIFCGDIVQAKRILDLGLEKEGYVYVDKVKESDRVNTPWVSFTEKAKPYLAATPKEDLKYQRQNVKVGTMKLSGVRDIRLSDDGKSAKVSYLISYTGLTPFAKVFKIDYSKPVKMTAYFVHKGDRWHLDQKSK